MRVVGSPQRGQKPLVLCHHSACMAMPPSDKRSSGSFVPRIGTSVSRFMPSGRTASFGSSAVKQGVPRSVPSQNGSLTADSSPAGSAPSGRRSALPVGTTTSCWSWTSSQCPRASGWPPPRFAGSKSAPSTSRLKGR